jgi:autotransporter strand-loop-strand O-heptosyltransferase
MTKYLITHCDKNFINHAEKLFVSLERFSNLQVIFFTIDFDYFNRFNNVKNIRYDVNKNINNLHDIKAYSVFLKPTICKKVFDLDFIKNDDVFCYIDADCLATANCDNIFNYLNSIEDYPLLNEGCHDFMISNGRGDPFVNNSIDLSLTLEAPLLKILNFDIYNRKKYLQTGVFLFNFKCKEFLNLWESVCFDNEVLSNWQHLTPFHEETVINCLLWQKNNLKTLNQVLINIPYYDSSDDDLIKTKNLFDKLKNDNNTDEFIYTFTKIPSIDKRDNIFFLHGKHSEIVYNFIDYNMSDLYIKINSPSLGDTIASTPTIRKLSKIYNKKINVVTHVKEVFLNNEYVNNVYSFEELDRLNLKIDKNKLFETFLGCGVKNEYGVEKKHNTIDIRQFHALDLGFMLLPDELFYDYAPLVFENIENLPSDYVCLHVSETWESRTYKKQNWQNLINKLNENNIPTVLIGKNSFETGFHTMQKNVFGLNLQNGLDLTNKLSLSQSWHVINKSKVFVTMDSGPMHLAGTTDAFIIQLGSSINNKLRAPYRNNSQDYKYKYISGPCGIFCASDMKYGIKEWGTIQGVPPLIKCLENKSSYECHPNVNQVEDFILNEIFFIDNEPSIEISNFNSEELYVEYFLKKEFKDKIKLKIIDNTNGFILHQESLSLSLNLNFWTTFKFCKGFITDSVSIIFESNGKILLNKKFTIYEQKNINVFSNLSFDKDVEVYSYAEIFYHKTYCKYGLDINENDVVVDIGSNQGAFIKYALDKKSSIIYSCDPNPTCISLIKKYYGNNKNLFLNEFAISDKCGESILYLGKDSDTSGSGKISEAQANIYFDYENGKKVKIKSITFKEFLKLNKINHIDFLKIDCEGGEVFVFIEENKDFIKNNVNKIVLEFHNEQHVNIVNYLKDLNYEVNIDYSLENLGMIFAKNKNKKIGLLLTAYNCENYVNPCLDPWMKLKEKHNIKIAVNSGMFSDYKALGFENRNQGTLDKLNKYKFDYFIKTDDQNLLDEDSSRNKCLNYLINEQHCDLIWILDADEIYKELEIENIINYVNKNDALYYSVNFKNYLFTKDYSSDYLPPRIFWTNKNSGIKKFHFDNHITYNDNSVSEALPHHEIPKNVAYVDHYSWLAEDSRTKEKIIYQNKRFAGEENAKCAFVWDDNYDCLIFNENFYQKRNLQKSFNYEPPKYLFITAHLSTGGSPKYLEWLIKETKKQNAKIKVIEWNLYSDTYVVQRNSIINMIGEDNFYTVGYYYEDDVLFNSKQQNIIDYIKDFNPDFIHLNEFSENFAIKPFSNEIINFLYDKERKHKLFETTHSANSDILNKRNIPDELWMVSKYQYDIAKETNIKTILVEIEVEKKTRPDREKILKSLGLDPDKMHVLQVGLFSINKNQKFTFEVANQFLNSNVQFHFVGNECYIDECGLDKNLNNCRIWGERSDVDLFMSCMDLFVMPSHEELNPIALKEAVSWNMKCFVSNLFTINNQYKNSKDVVFIENNNFLQYIKDNLNKFDNNTVPAIYSLNDEPNTIICSFNPSPKVEILGNENVFYNIKFIDDATGIMHFESNINTNMWTQSSIKYYCKWKIIVTNLKSKVENIYNLDLKNKSVKIINDSNSLGDSICWMAAVDKFQKLHNCKIDYYTAKKDLFINEYPNINFYDYGEVNNIDYYFQYVLGCFGEEKADFFRKDWRLQSLQEIAFSILGLDYIESKTKITIKNKFKLNFNKYVCIATQSTSQSRYWNNDGGWIKTVAYLQKLGYKVVCVDKYSNFGAQGFVNVCPSNVNYFAGNHSFEEIIDIINGCEFFIGLSSGLSWLTWAIGKKIISINGSVGSNFEFYTPYRIINSNVCNGCFNNINYKFSSSDWKWCPTNKNFECSKTIKFEIVKEVVDDLISTLKN